MTLDASRVVIVGGSSGIGRGVADAVLARGAEVVLVGRSRDKLQGVSAALGGPPRARAVAADVTREDEVGRMFAEAGPFDHLVVTSGFPAAAPIAELDLSLAREMVETILIGAITLAKHAHGRLRSGGSITLTSGISKDRPPIPGGAAVAAVAGSLSYLARALARELAPTRVNVVSPGWVDTPIWDTLVGPEKTAMWREMASRLPAGRIGTPADLAPAYVFFMESEFTTGTTLEVDGGHALI